MSKVNLMMTIPTSKPLRLLDSINEIPSMGYVGGVAVPVTQSLHPLSYAADWSSWPRPLRIATVVGATIALGFLAAKGFELVAKKVKFEAPNKSIVDKRLRSYQTRVDKEMERIAERHLSIPTLETRKSDSLDFHDVSVWGVKSALDEAYRFGVKSAYKIGMLSVQDEFDAPQSEKKWTTKQLMGEVAAMLVRMENDKCDDAKTMAELIVGDTDYHAKAYEEYAEEHEEELDFEAPRKRGRRARLININPKRGFNKRYDITENSDRSVTVVYGPIGGWEQTKKYPKGMFDKIYNEKIKKGYEEA